MATVRELRNKIRSVKNTKKITRTMEMISTAKARFCQKRIEAVQPYGNKLAELLRNLRSGAGGGEGSLFPLLRTPDPVTKELLFVVTANRGLCGGYNTNVLRMAEKYIDRRVAEGARFEVHMIGKKGAARFRYVRRDIAERYVQFDDKPTFVQAEEVISPHLERFCKQEIDGITVISTHYVSATRQHPVELRLLPIPASAQPEKGKGAAGGSSFLLEPSPEAVLESLVPLSLKAQFFQTLVEAAASEQIARRVAMKNASDNAEEMTHYFTQLYNRTRQSKITQEILEVIGGAESVA